MPVYGKRLCYNAADGQIAVQIPIHIIGRQNAAQSIGFFHHCARARQRVVIIGSDLQRDRLPYVIGAAQRIQQCRRHGDLIGLRGEITADRHDTSQLCKGIVYRSDPARHTIVCTENDSVLGHCADLCGCGQGVLYLCGILSCIRQTQVLPFAI